MKLKGAVFLTIASLVTFFLDLSQKEASADTLILPDGTEIICLIHQDGESQIFKPVGPDELEFEYGRIVMKIKRKLIKDYTIDPTNYVPPEDEGVIYTIFPPTAPGEPGEEGGAGISVFSIAVQVPFVEGFAWQLDENEARDSVTEGRSYAPGFRIEVARNSRAMLMIPPRVWIGVSSKSRVQVKRAERRSENDFVTYDLDLDLQQGRIWIDVRELGNAERTRFLISEWGFEVKSPSLLTVERTTETGYSVSLWRGQSTLDIVLPASPGFILNLGKEIYFDAEDAQAQIRPYDLSLGGEETWDFWETFVPQTFDLGFRTIYPMVELLPSYDIDFGVRELSVWNAVEPRRRVQNNILDDVALYEEMVLKFRADTGRLPTREEGLRSLLENPGIPGWRGPYLDEGLVRTDPWENPYRYIRLGQDDFLVYSSGPNVADDFGLGDDIH